MQNLYNKKKKLQDESSQFYEEIGKFKEGNTLIYLNNDSYPKYTNYDSYWGGSERNIREETLKGIKRVLGITNLSSLKASEIEEVVKKLIDKRLNNNKEYHGKINKRDIIEEEIEDIEEKIDELKGEKKDFWEKESELYNKINRTEREEEIKRDLKNPQKRNRAKRLSKREEARIKLKNFNSKLEDIHIEIIKERIVNNLEEEDDI